VSTRAVVVLNPAARHGTARRRFGTVSHTLHRELDLTIVETDPDGRWRGRLACEVGKGVRLVIAAGGDGTVGAVAGALLDCPGGGGVALGAVGLGSSNDFHKPFAHVQGGVPLRIDARRASPRDVARARYACDGEAPRERAFLVSASIGATARANARFNEGRDALLSLLKRRWVDGAVIGAALATLRGHSNLPALVRLEGEEHRVAISNLSVLKTPFLSGCLRYDTPVAPDSGLLAVNLCDGMGRGALLRVLLGLARGCFAGRRGTRHWTTPEVEVELAEPAPLELDGEVTQARRVRFDVLPRRLLACA
jgi:diacylglycerol kinase family enzyme